MIIENLTLAHFRHFSSLFTNSPPLHLSRTLYKSDLFMQNKPNPLNAQIYINVYDTKDYKNFIPLAGQKNKPNSNPIKPNFRKAQMSANSCATKEYENKRRRGLRKNKAKTNPISQRVKLMQSVYLQRNMKKNAAKDYEKTNPKQTQFKSEDRGQISEVRCQMSDVCLLSSVFCLRSSVFGSLSSVLCLLFSVLSTSGCLCTLPNIRALVLSLWLRAPGR